MKKWILYSLIVSLIIPKLVYADTNDEEPYYINNNGIEMTEREYNNLLKVGFSEFVIANMDLEKFNENKDYDDAFVEAEGHRYYKTEYDTRTGEVLSNVEITKEEFDNAELNCRGSGYVATTYKELTSNITYLTASSKRFRTSMVWLNIPVTRSYDIMGSGFSTNDIYIFDSAPDFDMEYCYGDGSCTYQNNNYYFNDENDGMGVSFQLPTTTIVSLNSTMYYTVKKNTQNTITYLRMCGDYAHAITTVSGANSQLYGLGYDGLYLDSTIMGSYDEMNCAEASWSGSW